MENETKILSDLNSPMIVKYYKTFKEDGALFIVMEYMDNGDLGGILKANKALEKPIPEEKLYDIFIQSMRGLSYLHSLDVIHRDIKPENLFITVDDDENFDLQIVDIPIKYNQNVYSKELVDIIYKMIDVDKNTRPTADEVLKLLIQEFNKKYAKISSIGSVLCGLYSLRELYEYLMRPQKQELIRQNSGTKPISFAFLYGIQSIINAVNLDWNNSLDNIKNIFKNDNYIYSENKEMEPRRILNYLLRKLHKELAKNQNNYVKQESILVENVNKDVALKKFLHLPYINSPIFSLFYGIMKTKSSCCACQTCCYSFNYYFYVSFDIEMAMKIQKNNNNLSIEHLFMIQNNLLIKVFKTQYKVCENCKTIQEFLQRKQFYTLPPFLIVCLDRGSDCQFKNKVAYNLQMNLNNQVENKKSITSYGLTGIVKRLDKGDKEHYICIYFDFMINSWVLRNDSEIKKLNSPYDCKEGIEMIFFYRNCKNNIVQQSSF